MPTSSFFGSGVRINAWMDDRMRPASSGALIEDNPSSVSFIRQNKSTQATTTLSAQTVRIELASLSASERQLRGANGVTSSQRLVILGYKGHPTETDTDIQRGDRFELDDRYYTVKTVEPAMPHFVQALCEVMDG